MPEASMYEYDDTVSGKHEVWCAREVTTMEPITQA